MVTNESTVKAREIIESVRVLDGWGLDGRSRHIRRQCDEHGRIECPLTAYVAHFGDRRTYPVPLAVEAAGWAGIPRREAFAVIRAAAGCAHARLRAQVESLIG